MSQDSVLGLLLNLEIALALSHERTAKGIRDYCRRAKKEKLYSARLRKKLALIQDSKDPVKLLDLTWVSLNIDGYEIGPYADLLKQGNNYVTITEVLTNLGISWNGGTASIDTEYGTISVVPTPRMPVLESGQERDVRSSESLGVSTTEAR